MKGEQCCSSAQFDASRTKTGVGRAQTYDAFLHQFMGCVDHLVY